MSTRNHMRWNEGLCMALRRFAYPRRLSDLIPRFGRPVPELSMISSLVVDTIYQENNHRITRWNDTLLNPALLQTYARAIQQNGSPLHSCFGFINGTVRPICRPDQNQRIVYNGHKRAHGLKYQSLALPNGMLANMYGPVGNFIIEVIHLFGWILKFHANRKPQYHLCLSYFRGQKAWFSHVGRFWSSWWTRATCVLNNKRTNASLWWLGLSSACSPPGILQRSRNYTTNGAIQQSHEFRSHVCRVAFRVHCKLF